MKFQKYHALGNDYVVLNPSDFGDRITPGQIRLICHCHYGVGSDGILFGPLQTAESDFALRFFNPDGTEAEKSGNGLRIFSRYLWDRKLVGEKPFTISTKGGKTQARVHRGGQAVTVDMGRVSFDSTRIPVAGPHREVLNETIMVGEQALIFSAATIGNPHCVILRGDVTPEEAIRWGPLIEHDARFPNRANVQFMKILDRWNIQIEVWERGAGYTLASGSSSCAAAAVAHRLGLCNASVSVHMPGGTIDVTVSEEYSISMTGPVTRIAEGALSPEMFDQGL